MENTLFEYSLGGEVPKIAKWFHHEEFKAFLTSTGLDYLNQYRVIQSNLELNEASKRNGETQKKHAQITLWVAIAAVASSIFGLIQSYHQDSKYNQNIQSIENGINKLKDTTNRIPIELYKLNHKDSILKKQR